MPEFQKQAVDYDEWFDRHPVLFESELTAIRSVLPPFQRGVEIGVGTGRFAAALGIQFGLEPLDDFAAIARSQGIEVKPGVAEKMPYPGGHFDLALMVTVDCFLDDVPAAFAEAFRVLSPGGSFVVAFLDKNGAIARKYKRRGSSSYRNARFHSPDEIMTWMNRAGFGCFKLAQTLFDGKETEPQRPESGVGRGSFAVIAGKKPG
ncbi:MAG: class I SAM-dependent methyltransferase [Saprospirales bacterium]|nr:class I SAM-dependent methyltransferase [Saprospirales bacterium]